ncbi:glycosyl hydrolase 53 family protein [Alteromonadaceae bacterium BrNp21-10]|nr:glycosyl hydrolase 53 family protein [Alteromonadaceae bacterium BrNp21-10]
MQFKLSKIASIIAASTLLTFAGCSGNGANNASAPATVVPPTTELSPAADPRDSNNYILGADISSYSEMLDKGVIFVDTDGEEKSLLALLKNHGFNSIRLRTFVDPAAPYGYASSNHCPGKLKDYNSKQDIVELAQQVKAAGMSLLLDFHYSDTWADPNKQVIPQSWRHLASVEDMADQLNAYTVDVMQALADVDALPAMVQVGNEITPGMLLHTPTDATDCYGNNSAYSQNINGSSSNWEALSTLLKAGIGGVKQVSPESKIMLHVENTEHLAGIIDWVNGAQSQGVEFDVLGLSAYEKWQGPSSAWPQTLESLGTTFPQLTFSIVEYNPQRRLLNDIMYNLPDSRGVGTYFWEPALSGEWGQAMFTINGNRYTAKPQDFAEYDKIKTDFGL